MATSGSCGRLSPRLVAAHRGSGGGGGDRHGGGGGRRGGGVRGRAVMVGPAVTGEIVSGGLADPDTGSTRPSASTPSRRIRRPRGKSECAGVRRRQGAAPWLPWLECDLDDDVVGPAASAAAAAAVRAAPSTRGPRSSRSSAASFTTPRGEGPRRRRASRAPWATRASRFTLTLTLKSRRAPRTTRRARRGSTLSAPSCDTRITSLRSITAKCARPPSRLRCLAVRTSETSWR